MRKLLSFPTRRSSDLREVYEFWPGEFLTLFEKAGVPQKTPPPFLPETGSEIAMRSGHSPRIISPTGKEILLASIKTVPLRAKVDADVQKIYWFAGKKFIGQAAPNEFVGWDVDAGDYEITA